MSIPIKTTTVYHIGAKIINILPSGDNEINEVYPGDTVSAFKYKNDGEVATIDGRIADIGVYFKKSASASSDSFSKIENDGTVTYFTIDSSEVNNSNLTNIDAEDVLEYNTESEVSKVVIEPVAKASVTITMSDGTVSSADLEIGSMLFDAVVNDETVDIEVVQFIYNKNYYNNNAYIDGIVGKNAIGEFAKYKFSEFKSLGKSAVEAEASNLTSAISEAISDETKGGVVVGAGECTDALSITGNVNICGNYSGVDASKGTRKSFDIGENETVLKGAVTIENGAEKVTFNGLTFTEESLVNINKNVKDVSFVNCKFTNMTPNATKSFLLYCPDNSSVTDPVSINITNCYFGDNQRTNNDGNMYNLFELYGQYSNLNIDSNYFDKNCATHNIINVYNMYDGCKMIVNNNTFERSANACRIGTKGAVKNCEVSFNNNTIFETDVEPWEGIVLIQPYGKVTTDLSGLTISVNKNKIPDMKHQIYMYYGANDMEITHQNAPKMFEDGKSVFNLVDKDGNVIEGV